jgi:hypothetical protein
MKPSAPNPAGMSLTHLREPTLQEGNINGRGSASENVPPTIRQLEASRPNGLEQARLLEVGRCPADPVVQPRLPTSEKLRSVVVRELKLLGQLLDRFGKGVLLTVTRQLQQRKHQGLEVRNSHVVRNFRSGLLTRASYAAHPIDTTYLSGLQERLIVFRILEVWSAKGNEVFPHYVQAGCPPRAGENWYIPGRLCRAGPRSPHLHQFNRIGQG